MTELAQIGALFHDGGQTLGGRIRRAVVDIDDLIGEAAVERGRNLRDQRNDVLRFVPDGNDDGNRDIGVGGRQS